MEDTYLDFQEIPANVPLPDSPMIFNKWGKRFDSVYGCQRRATITNIADFSKKSNFGFSKKCSKILSKIKVPFHKNK